MSKPTGYSISSYGDMITCEPRMSAYADALRLAVTPGCTVIDIGAGSGVFSILACKYGAGSVIAIEPDNSVELLRLSAETNGCLERIEIVQGLSTEFHGPAKADVIISDLRGCLPLFEAHIPSIIDARERLLAPNGSMIPARDVIRIALVHHPDGQRALDEPWLRNKFGIDLSDGRRFVINEWRKYRLEADALLSDPQDLVVLDYATIVDPNIAVVKELTATRNETAHGLLVWFDAALAPGIGYSNAPGEPPLVYGQVFFPFERAIELSTGDKVKVKIRADLIDNDYVWSWNSEVYRGSAKTPDAVFRQSTFRSHILPRAALERRNSNYVPPALTAHKVDQLCLSLFDGQAPLGVIAEQLAAAFPEEFASQTSALNHVAALAERHYSSVQTGEVARPVKSAAKELLE